MLAVGENEIAPHFHLSLTGVNILLNRVKEGPGVIFGHLESFDHFDIFAVINIYLFNIFP